MRSALLATLLTLALTGQALALSCIRPDVGRSYLDAAAASGRYVVVTGLLGFPQHELPQPVGNDSPERTRIPARITGQALSKTGFDHAFERNITLEVGCLGPWCGQITSGKTYLAFVELDPEAGYVLRIGPCGGTAFQDPTPAMLERVQTCNSGGACTPE